MSQPASEPMPELIDIGANLTHDSFDPDRDAVIGRAQAVGVGRMIVTGATCSGSEQAVQFAAERPGELYATAGVHPHHASEYDADTHTLLLQLASTPLVVAVGECGLDYFRNFSPPDAQKKAFAAQLAIGVDVQKPVFLHQRDAHDDFVAMLGEQIDNLTGGVAHCFTGGTKEMNEYLEMGLYIGITGWVCDERRGHDLQEAVPHLPLDRLLLETDAPYLMPRDLPKKLSGRRNEPCVLPHVLETVARLMGRDIAEVASAATRNTERLFNL
ncbi:MAG: hydrolase TatD [Gammaproteobacteria bacterium]|nr:MAG: hydrolase TatD [Gammaproteobacteria bacterium]